MPSSDALFDIVPPEGGGGVAPFFEEEELRFSLVLTGEFIEGKVANLGGRAELGGGAPGGIVFPPEGRRGFSY